MSDDTTSATTLQQDLDGLGVSIDRLIEERNQLLASVRDFVGMYEGLDGTIGPSVQAKVDRARTALANAEGARS